MINYSAFPPESTIYGDSYRKPFQTPAGTGMAGLEGCKGWRTTWLNRHSFEPRNTRNTRKKNEEFARLLPVSKGGEAGHPRMKGHEYTNEEHKPCPGMGMPGLP
jgi:hypothetical protein